MSIWRLVLIECNGEDGPDGECNRTWRSTSDDYEQARRDAARQGWTLGAGYDTDYCPDHGKA